MDLFAGCGGFSEGFRSYTPGGVGSRTVFETIAAVDFDRAALATFQANHPSADVMNLDIEEFDPDPFANSVDVITGGPPCQGFSGLNNKGGRWDDPRNSLWRQYVRVVSTVQPKVFVIENVDRFKKSHEYEGLLESVKPGGPLSDYTLVEGLLNAADYGVPQARKRTIVIGTHRALGASIPLPPPTHSRNALQQASDFLPFDGRAMLQPWVPVDEVFDRSDRLSIKETVLPERSRPDGIPGPFLTTELHIGRVPQALSLARYAVIPPGGNRKDLRGKWALIDGREVYLSTASWDGHNSGSGDVMGRLKLGHPSVTVRTEFFKPEKGRYLHPVEHRPITHYEAALIQGFPEGYLWHGTKIEIAKQIGNAVPVGLAQALAGVIHDRLELGTSANERTVVR
ncbi:DNA cytosine methyltransferase [Streptomyces actinomycinicus]|uniref:Cytosine-specific methyltransferase n=1 Tax=Streptomyces actinomycinicus TaxID=1695166 RepID=A0A937ENV9_9ACTN|nr:DNA cytosine methyltransferase [Streptomyces actinomycinicus]MBL1085847.1 DNA cytosine methyltransferase [Streptomyces actinomycinicus]